MTNGKLIWAPLPPDEPDREAWEKAAADFSTNRLVRVQGTAEKWAATATSLIGVFSAVALIGGTDELGKVDNGILKAAVIALTVLAGVFAFSASWRASQAAQGPLPTANSNYNAHTYRDWVNNRTLEATEKLRKARISGLTAAVLVGAVAAVSLVNAALPAATAPSSTAVVVREDGGAVCGKLSAGDGQALEVDGVVVEHVHSVVPVDKC